ncbi:MAG: hypothetical protein N3C13_03290 [Aquificaceae bacterium]|nr:hypothetical protein [Aquificaceae bacterium]
MVMLSVGKKEDNILHVGDFVVNLVSEELSEKLNGGRRRRPQWAGWALASARWLR